MHPLYSVALSYLKSVGVGRRVAAEAALVISLAAGVLPHVCGEPALVSAGKITQLTVQSITFLGPGGSLPTTDPTR